jgi:hypothetical protein
MKLAIAMLVFLSALPASAAPGRAQEQTQAPAPSIERRSAELATWLEDYRAWEKWFEQWGNRVEKNFNNDQIWTRKKRPEPPAWLARACQDDPVFDEQMATGCNILLTWDEQPMQMIRRRDTPVTTSGGKVADTVVKSSFFQRVHLTGLWTRAQYPGMPVYGIVGMQVAVVEIGRYTLPATGVMLVMVPDGAGGHEWKPATTLGFAYRLFDFVPPMRRTPVSLHINIARTHIHGIQDERIIPGGADINFVGFSVSGRRRH